MDSSEFDTVFKNESSIEQLLHVGKYFSIERVKIEHRWEIRKSINENERKNPVCLESLKREFEIGSQLQHPSFCSYYQLSNDKFFLNREYIDGLSWSDFFQTYPSEKYNIEKYITQLLEAIHYMHSKGIFHMDLKSENILVSYELKKIKIIDFGHALYYNDTLWRGGMKNDQNMNQLINAKSDWISFFSLIQMIQSRILRKSSRKIKRAYQGFVRNSYVHNYEQTKAIFEHEFNLKFIFSLITSFGFVFCILFILLFNDYNSPKINGEHSRKTENIQNKKISNNSKTPIKLADEIETEIRSNKPTNLDLFKVKDSLYLVMKANEFGPEFESIINNSNSNNKLALFNNLVQDYYSRFDRFPLLKNLDSSQKQIAKDIYIYHISKSINKHIYLLK